MRNPTHSNRSGLRHFGLRGLATLLLFGVLSGCGSNTSSDEAIVVVESADITSVIKLPNNSAGVGIGVVGPLIFRVLTSASDPTPVAGANITLAVGGAALSAARMEDVFSHATVSDGFGLYSTKTDSRGVVKVDAFGTTVSCPNIPPGGNEQTFSGNLSVAAFVAGSTQSWTMSFTLTCAAP